MVKKSFLAIVAGLMLVGGTIFAQEGKGGGFGGGRGGGGRGDGVVNIVETVTEATGLALTDLRAALESGKTLAEVITENGATVEDVTAQIIQTATDEVNQRVTDGQLTQARADEILANLATRVEEAMNSTTPVRGLMGDRGGDGILNFAETVSEATGLTLTELRTALESGKTLAEVITENGSTVEAVTAQITQTVTDEVNQRVTDGQLTQARADEILANLATRIDEAMNSTTPVRGLMGDRGGDGIRGAILDQVVEATGLELSAITEQVQAGKTLGEILTENNVDLEQFVTDATAARETELAQAVTDGKISQAVMDARLNLFRVELLDRLNGVGEAK